MLIPLVSFDNFHIPLLCSLVVFLTGNLFTCFLGSNRKVKVGCGDSSRQLPGTFSAKLPFFKSYISGYMNYSYSI